MKRAWDEVVALVAPFLKLALFIDRLDEFDSDHTNLTELLRSLATLGYSRSVKNTAKVRLHCTSVYIGLFTLHTGKFT